jgi:hypothetical protein
VIDLWANSNTLRVVQVDKTRQALLPLAAAR